jgi:hypothetical protein
VKKQAFWLVCFRAVPVKKRGDSSKNPVKCRVEVEELSTRALQGDQYFHFTVALCFCANQH